MGLNGYKNYWNVSEYMNKQVKYDRRKKIEES